MYFLDTLQEITFYRMGMIFKTIANVVFIVVPIIIMIFCISDVIKIVFRPDEARAQVKTVVDRIIAGLIIFILPTIINYAMTLVDTYNKDKIFKYYEGASKQKIESLELKYENEQKAEKNRKEAEFKEAAQKAKLEEDKRRAQQEEMFKEWQEKRNNNNNNNGGSGGSEGSGGSGGGSSDSGGSYSGDSTGGGTFGSVTVTNGVFHIPNKRATSDSDIPKQSGQYGLNPIFWERLSKLIQDGKAKGYKIGVTSGWRSYSSQRSLWDNSSRPCSQRSKWVACPGGSRHGFGIAADLKFNGSSCSGGWDCNAAAKWAHANAGNYGLKFRMSWEPWHIEPAQVTGGSFGSCKARC